MKVWVEVPNCVPSCVCDWWRYLSETICGHQHKYNLIVIYITFEYFPGQIWCASEFGYVDENCKMDVILKGFKIVYLVDLQVNYIQMQFVRICPKDGEFLGSSCLCECWDDCKGCHWLGCGEPLQYCYQMSWYGSEIQGKSLLEIKVSFGGQ